MRYPFAWFGILAEAPFSSDELISCHSLKGFALISQRTPTVQRMYFQCAPDTDVSEWDDERIWDHRDAILAGPDGFTRRRGPIFDTHGVALPARRPRAHAAREPVPGRDAAHTVPPTGAKGLNLAFGDVALLAPALLTCARTGSRDGLSTYGARRSAHLDVTELQLLDDPVLHTPTDENPFLVKRQIGELLSVVSSQNAMKYLAECYTGRPNDRPGLMES